jgi:hypothetical protein
LILLTKANPTSIRLSLLREEQVEEARRKLRIQSKNLTIDTLLDMGLLFLRSIEKGHLDSQDVQDPLLQLLVKKLTPEDNVKLVREFIRQIGQEEFDRIIGLVREHHSRLES